MKPEQGLLSFRTSEGVFKLHLDNKLEGSHSQVRIARRRQRLKHGEVLSLELTADRPLELSSFRLSARIDKGCTMLTNGFQSWSGTYELGAEDRLPGLSSLTKPLLASYGDYHLLKYSNRPGQFHSWSWAGFNYGDHWLLLASTAEDQGYTLFKCDLKQSRLIIQRECAGTRTSRYRLLELYIGRGSEQDLWDEYAGLLPGIKPPRVTGWTSWYNYYTEINEDIILENLDNLSGCGLPFDFFQIDDGWQEAIGDWLQVNGKFPAGLDSLARAAEEKGLRPGLWLAPFICEPRSRLWRENYDWVLKDKRGRPVKAGWNPGWRGWFYALDFYAPGFQDYLGQVFHTILNRWGFAMVKLDFLYAAALLPNRGKNRGQVMGEAMDFIRRQCGEKTILGCGVPLGPAVGRVDHCRVGGDVAPYWEDNLLALVNYRERVSTANSLACTLHRHMLNGRFFGNDPDVFLLRDGRSGATRNKLTPDQRHTLLLLKNLLGRMILFSDNVGEYTPQQKEQLAAIFPWPETSITGFANDKDVYTITVAAKDCRWLILANLTDRKRPVSLPAGSWFNPETGLASPGTELLLKPHQTRCFAAVEENCSQPQVLGSSGHLLPGAQVESLTPQGENWLLKLKPHASPYTRVWIGLPRGLKELTVNGHSYPMQNNLGIPHIIV